SIDEGMNSFGDHRGASGDAGGDELDAGNRQVPRQGHQHRRRRRCRAIRLFMCLRSLEAESVPEARLTPFVEPSGSSHSVERARGRMTWVAPESDARRTTGGGAVTDHRVQFDFQIEFSNGGDLDGHAFRLDIEGDDISDQALADYLVRDMRLLMVGSVRIRNK